LSKLNSIFKGEQNGLSRLNTILWLNSIFRTTIDLNRLNFLDQKSILAGSMRFVKKICGYER